MNSTPPNSGLAGSEPLKRDYWCFISFRHSDNKALGRKWATWLHQTLETYEVPSHLVKTRNERGDIIPDRIFPVFRDEEELPADAELPRLIESALRRSRFLVVLCSPQAAKSRFVADEILTFKRLGKKDRILAAIIEGEPNASDDPLKGGMDKECFPQPLRFEVDEAGRATDTRTEPLAANFRLPDGTPGWTTPAPYREALKEAGLTEKQIEPLVAEYSKQQNLMLLKIVAGVLGVPLGVLTQRDKAYQLEKQKQRARVLRRWLVALAVLAVATIASAFWALHKRAEAIAAQNLAEERLYLSGIQAAAAQAEDGNFSAARQTLVTLPKDHRNHEWYLLMEWAGAPILRVGDLESWMQRHEKEQPKLIGQIRAAAKLLPAGDEHEPPAYVEAPDRSCAVFIDGTTGRGGGFACVITGAPSARSAAEQIDPKSLVYSKDPSVIVRIATENYGGVTGVAFTPDSSMLLVQASLIRDYAEAPVYNLGDREGEIYIVPIPNRFYPVKSPSAAGNQKDSAGEEKDSPSEEKDSGDEKEGEEEANPRDSGEAQTPGSKSSAVPAPEPTITFGARHGKDVVATVVIQQADGGGEERYRYQRPWPGVAVTALTSGAAADRPDGNSVENSGESRVDVDMLPDPVRLRALKLLEGEDGKAKRSLAAVRSGPAGSEGLFFVSGAPALLERWDLEKNELTGQLGPGIQLKETAFDGLTDWGAAYNRDGSRIFAFPISDLEDGEIPGIFDVSTGKLIQSLPAISFAGEQARGAFPVLGFSFSGKYVYASILDGALPSNDIWIAEKRANGYVPLEPAEDNHIKNDQEEDRRKADLDEPTRFVGWSPDDALSYYVSDESETLRVKSADGVFRNSIPNAVRNGAYPVFDQLPAAAENIPQGRYAFGGFIFSPGGSQPILRLPIAWMDPEMRSVIFRNGVGNYDLVTGSLGPRRDHPSETAALLLLKWWIDMADTKPVRSAPSKARPTLQAQPTISATASPSSVVSPPATSVPAATPFPSAEPAHAATASPPTTDRTSSPAAVSPAAKVSPVAVVPTATARNNVAGIMSEVLADQQLNDAYTALRKSLDQAAKRELKREQVEWLKRRDAMADPTARAKFIQQRTAELEQRTRR